MKINEQGRIKELPDLPQGILDAVNRGELAVFIGAGVSRLIGCRSWWQLASDLVNRCYNKGFILYKEQNRLLSESNPKKIITVCKHILENHGAQDDYYAAIEASLKADKDRKKKYPIYRQLLDFRAAYISTNVDLHFDEFFEEYFIFTPRTLNPQRIRPLALYHIHGSLKEKEDMVFTTADYLRQYRNERVNRFLTELFSKRTVLFIGYGLEEFEVLDFVISRLDKGTKVRNHYVLQGMFENEENILEFEQAYYGDMGITVIPYAMDRKGYDQLYHVIEAWQREINETSNFTELSFRTIERALTNYSEENAQEVFQLIRNDAHLANHFFNHVESLDWLFPLVQRGYFAPGQNPIPERVDGGITNPFWFALYYLEKVSDRITEQSDPIYGNTIMNIIRAVTADEMTRELRTARTDSAFVDIMSKLPTQYLTLDDLELIRHYLGYGWVGADASVADNLFPKVLTSGSGEQVQRLLDIVFSFSWSESNQLSPLMQEFWLHHLISNHRMALEHNYAWDATTVLVEKAKSLVAHDPQELDVVWIPAIEPHEQNQFPERYQNVLVSTLRSCLVKCATDYTERTRILLNNLFNERHSFFKRIVLSVVDETWTHMGSVFDVILSRQLFTNLELRHEMYTLLKRHFEALSDLVKEKIVKWIDEGPEWDMTNIPPEEVDKYIASWKQQYLHALLGAGYAPAVELYNACKSVTGSDPHYPDFVVAMEYWTGPTNLLTADAMSQLSCTELVHYLSSNNAQWSIADRERVGEEFSLTVQRNPDRYLNEYAAFLTAPFLYVYKMVEGFRYAMDNTFGLNVFGLVRVVNELLQSPVVQTSVNQDDHYSDYQAWFFGQALGIVDRALLNRQSKLSTHELAFLKSVVVDMHNRITNVLTPQQIADARLDSRLLDCLVEYATRYARLSGVASDTVKWEDDVRALIEDAISGTPNLAWWETFGAHLFDMFALDSCWVMNKLDQMFADDVRTATMCGYVFGAVDLELYSIIRDRGYYAEFLTLDVDAVYRKRLIDHITIAFQLGIESVANNSLFGTVIRSGNPVDLKEVLFLFWRQHEHPTEPLRDRAQELWRCLNEIYTQRQDTLSDHDRQVLSELCKLTSLLSAINEENLEWLLLAAPFVGYNAPFLIKALVELADVTPDAVGQVYLRVLDGEIPTYEQTDIQSLVRKLYDAGEMANANRICNRYFTANVQFLRPLYAEHNPDPDQ